MAAFVRGQKHLVHDVRLLGLESKIIYAERNNAGADSEQAAALNDFKLYVSGLFPWFNGLFPCLSGWIVVNSFFFFFASFVLSFVSVAGSSSPPAVLYLYFSCASRIIVS